MALFMEGSEGADAAERIADAFGPGHVDQMIRQGIQSCWMSLPKGRRTTEELERQVRRIVERALKDFREDQQVFGREDKA